MPIQIWFSSWSWKFNGEILQLWQNKRKLSWEANRKFVLFSCSRRSIECAQVLCARKKKFIVERCSITAGWMHSNSFVQRTAKINTSEWAYTLIRHSIDEWANGVCAFACPSRGWLNTFRNIDKNLLHIIVVGFLHYILWHHSRNENLWKLSNPSIKYIVYKCHVLACKICMQYLYFARLSITQLAVGAMAIGVFVCVTYLRGNKLTSEGKKEQ